MPTPLELVEFGMGDPGNMLIIALILAAQREVQEANAKPMQIEEDEK